MDKPLTPLRLLVESDLAVPVRRSGPFVSLLSVPINTN